MLTTILLAYLITCIIFFVLVIRDNPTKLPKKLVYKLVFVSLVWWVAVIIYFFTNED